MNIYRHRFTRTCPNNGAAIAYELEIKSDEIIMVERIVRVVRTIAPSAYHESIADALAMRLPGLHTIRAHHHGVDIETIRGEKHV